MSEPASESAFPGDEIRLADLLRILAGRWGWIVTGIVLGMVIGFAYVALRTPVFEANAKLRVGQVVGSGAFETGELLSLRLIAQYGERRADGVVRAPPFLKRATTSQAAPASIELIAEGRRPNEPVELLQRLVGDLEAAHRAIYDRNVGYWNEQLRNIDAQRAALRSQYDVATALIEHLKVSNPVQASLVTLERGRILERIDALDAVKPQLAQRLAPPMTESTRLLGEIVAPTQPAALGLGVVLSVAAALGAIAGVVIALVAEVLRPSIVHGDVHAAETRS